MERSEIHEGMRELLAIRVSCQESCSVQGQKYRICMIPFTGEAYGDYFCGHIIGIGTDTQKFREGQPDRLSARYMLEGKDYTGADCRIFIENSLYDEEGWHPMIVTDSRALADWEEKDLIAAVDGIEGGVMVRIFEKALLNAAR